MAAYWHGTALPANHVPRLDFAACPAEVDLVPRPERRPRDPGSRSDDPMRHERDALRAAEALPLWSRSRLYLRMLGPGYLQSAMTLGGGSCTAAIFAGAVFGYQLLWVAPVAMGLGLFVLSAAAHQTLSSGIRPYEAMRRFAGPGVAFAWAGGALLASVIWHFPHYALGAALVADLSDALGGIPLPPAIAGAVVAALVVPFSLYYTSSQRAVRIYERVMRFLVWGIVLCFGAVVLRTGIDDPGALLRGFLAFEIPGDRNGIAGATLVLSGLSAAVGINMLFLYPYSLRARGWGREHRRLARLDLGIGTFLPYVLAMSLIVIATANTVHLDPDYAGTRLSPVEAASSLAGLLGAEWGRVAFGVGVLGMVLSSLTLHMVSAGFVCAEVFGWPLGGRRQRLATLIPLPGFLGCLLWTEIAIWIAVPTNIICGLLLPVVYLGFTRLQRSRAYLGEDVPSGPGGRFWIAGMCLATGVLAIFFFWYLLAR
ncbi:MAG: divalent metal cation transporter [Myxococcales bacterium]|nr:divalent metal cation transporter [Myxococcales bacterium]